MLLYEKVLSIDPDNALANSNAGFILTNIYNKHTEAVAPVCLL